MLGAGEGRAALSLLPWLPRLKWTRGVIGLENKDLLGDPLRPPLVDDHFPAIDIDVPDITKPLQSLSSVRPALESLLVTVPSQLES